MIAPRAKSFKGIDLTQPAVESTRKRMELLGVKTARVVQMYAEGMPFPNASFDYIWTWGVIHRSADTGRILEQMHRVLRPKRPTVRSRAFTSPAEWQQLAGDLFTMDEFRIYGLKSDVIPPRRAA